MAMMFGKIEDFDGDKEWFLHIERLEHFFSSKFKSGGSKEEVNFALCHGCIFI